MTDSSDPSKAGKKILVVDDDPGIRRVLLLALGDEGYEVRAAESGNEALELLQEQPVDLILSDVRMARGDGLFLLASVRDADRASPGFILMSGFSDLTEEEALERGADGFFHKPYKLAELLQSIEEFFQGQ